MADSELIPRKSESTLGYILVRVGFLLTILGVIFYLIWLLTQIHSLTLSPNAAQVIHNVISIASMIIAPVIFIAATPWRGHLNIYFSVFAVLLWLAALFLGLVVAVGGTGNIFGRDPKTGTYSLTTLNTRPSPLIGLALIMLVIIVPLAVADNAADKLQKGQPVTVYTAPGLRGFAVEEVKVRAESSFAGSHELDQRCVIFLGVGSSYVVLYDHESDAVYRLAAENIALSSDC
jgi:hypothetical protein